MHFRWERLRGRVCVLPAEHGGHEVVAWRCEAGWRVCVPDLGLDLTVRNRAFRTWITAGPVVDRVLALELDDALLELHSSPRDPAAWQPPTPAGPDDPTG